MFLAVCKSVGCRSYNLCLSTCADAVPRIYDDVSDVLATCQIAAFIEPINAAFKLVHTGVSAPLSQVGG